MDRYPGKTLIFMKFLSELTEHNSLTDDNEIEKIEVNNLTYIVLLRKNPSKLKLISYNIPFSDLKIEKNNNISDFYSKITYKSGRTFFRKIM